MITDARSVFCPVHDATQVGEARRAVARLAERMELDEAVAGKAAILVTELANNLYKHAREGAILLRRSNGRTPALEILAVDKGPGMDVEKCFRDGFSTVGTPGTGLGSVVRLADRWDVYSSAGNGTMLMAQVGPKPLANHVSQLELGSVTLPVKGEQKCGDNWAHTWNNSRDRLMVADGLGHGQDAAEAAEEAENIFREKEGHLLPDVMLAIHRALQKTRGAAVALAELDFERRVIRYVGVGNIAATILHQGTTRSLVSHNGTAGHEARKIQEFQYPWPEGALFIMTSDGLLTRWDLSKYPGLAARHPSLVAALLWRDFARGRDDTTAVAVRDKTRP